MTKSERKEANKGQKVGSANILDVISEAVNPVANKCDGNGVKP